MKEYSKENYQKIKNDYKFQKIRKISFKKKKTQYLYLNLNSYSSSLS